MLTFILIAILPVVLAGTCANIPPPLYDGSTPFKYCEFRFAHDRLNCAYQAVRADAACTYNVPDGSFAGRIAFYPSQTYAFDPNYGADICPGSVRFFEGTPGPQTVCFDDPFSFSASSTTSTPSTTTPTSTEPTPTPTPTPPCFALDVLNTACGDFSGKVTAIVGGICTIAQDINGRGAILAGLTTAMSFLAGKAKGDYSDFQLSTSLQVAGLVIGRIAAAFITKYPPVLATLVAIEGACQFRKLVDTAGTVDVACNYATGKFYEAYGADVGTKCPQKRDVFAELIGDLQSPRLRSRQSVDTEDPNYNFCTDALATIEPLCQVTEYASTCANDLAVLKAESIPGVTADLTSPLETLCTDLSPFGQAKQELCGEILQAIRDFEPFCTRAFINEIAIGYDARTTDPDPDTPPATPSKRSIKRDSGSPKSNAPGSLPPPAYTDLRCVAPLVPCAPFGDIDIWTCTNLQTSIDSCGACHRACELESDSAFDVSCVDGGCVARNFTRVVRPAPARQAPKYGVKAIISELSRRLKGQWGRWVGI